jgi:CheY-like chemotaxis protein
MTDTRARLLLVDDEPMILRLFTRLLKDRCQLEAVDGGAAAADLLSRDRAFDLILCDLQMPERDGISVYDAVERLEPALLSRFVFTTGGAVTARGREFLDRVRPRVLAKPFAIDELVALIGGVTPHAR